MTSLSKSRIQNGRQCHKRLWLDVHKRAAATWRPAAQARLDEGTRFGELAQQLLGRGVLIEAGHMQVREALEQTASCLARPREEVAILFEPAFAHHGVRVRVDALRREAAGDTLIEVKSTIRIKPEYLWDCAIQTWVARGAGRNVTRVMLGLVDSGFVYSVPGDFAGLLKLVDITAEVEALLPGIPDLVDTMQAVADGPMPSVSTGVHCAQPFGCPYLDHCRAGEPSAPAYPVSLLPNMSARLSDLLQAAVYRDLREIPDGFLYKPQHRRVVEATRSGRPFVSPGLAGLLEALPYPRFHLDFETLSHVVPRWLGTRPFQQLPFQFSCHIEPGDGSLRHEAFLDVSGESPIEGFVEKLLAVVGNDGIVVVWSKGFEATRLRELAATFPQHAGALLSIAERMIDLRSIYREHYYHRDMQAVWSINAVLPTLAPDLAHGDLAVTDGDGAQEIYRCAIAPERTSTERDELAQQLLAYCERNTLAMTRVTRFPYPVRTPDAAADGLRAADLEQPEANALATARP